jgi:putative tryptophan/tyrosine transport system substrate-binding protein
MPRRLIGLLVTLALGLLVAPLLAEAQPAGKVPRIGVLSTGSPPATLPRFEPFIQRLRELGYVEGQTIALEYRFADGKNEWLPALAAELIDLTVEVIVTSGTPATVAAKQATSMIPIIIATAADPVGAGLVASLARPGGNVTGMANLDTELSGKRLEILKAVVPGLSRVAILWNVVSADGVHGFERFNVQNVRRGSPGACAAHLEAIGPVGKGTSARPSASTRRIRAPIAGPEPDGIADDLGHRWS